MATPRTSARGKACVEAVALGALAAAPLFAYFAYLAAHPVPRFAVQGDYAGLELAVRHVGSGTLLGAYSRFQWNHPGPLWFFLAKPVYALYALRGDGSTGLFAAACAINALSAAAVVAGVRAFASRAHAIGALLVVLAWLTAFGDVAALPWNPLTSVLPLLAFFVFAALFARGASRAAPFGVFFGALAAQTHISTAPEVLAIGLAASAAFLRGSRRRARSDASARAGAGGDAGATRDARPRTASAPRARRDLAVAAVVLLVVSAPAIVEQLASPVGNLTKLAGFFLHRPEPAKPLTEALRDWAFATTWLPDRLFSLSLPKDGYEPATMMGSDPMPRAVSAYTVRVVLVTAAATIAACVAARRRRDSTSLALGLTGIGASLVAIVALRGVVGRDLHYLFFWTTACTATAWMACATTLASALASALASSRRARGASLRRAAGFLVVLAAAAGAASVQRAWLEKRLLTPPANAHYRALHDALASRVAARGETPVVHLDGPWNLGMELLLELDKDGLSPRVVARDRWLAGRQLATADAPPARGPLVHVWIASPDASPAAIERCLDPLAASGGLRLLASDHDVTACPPDPAR